MDINFNKENRDSFYDVLLPKAPSKKTPELINTAVNFGFNLYKDLKKSKANLSKVVPERVKSFLNSQGIKIKGIEEANRVHAKQAKDIIIEIKEIKEANRDSETLAGFQPDYNENGELIGGKLFLPSSLDLKDNKSTQTYCAVLSHELLHIIYQKEHQGVQRIMSNNDIDIDNMKMIFGFTELINSYVSSLRIEPIKSIFELVGKKMKKLCKNVNKEIDNYGFSFQAIPLPLQTVQDSINQIFENPALALSEIPEQTKSRMLKTVKSFNALKDYFVEILRDEAVAYSVNAQLNKMVGGMDNNAITFLDLTPMIYERVANILDNMEITEFIRYILNKKSNKN